MDIRAEVANALHWDLALPRHRVTAEVNDGLVTLHGLVEPDYQKSCPEATVRRVPGVIGVRNEIAVQRWNSVSRLCVPSLDWRLDAE